MLIRFIIENIFFLLSKIFRILHYKFYQAVTNIVPLRDSTPASPAAGLPHGMSGVWDVSFGRFYNGAFPAMENLVKLGDIAKTLQQMFEACVAANPAKRPNPSGQDEEGKSRLHNNEINYVFM